MPRSVPRMIGSGVSSRSLVAAGMYGSNAALAGTSGLKPTTSGYSFSTMLILSPALLGEAACCRGQACIGRAILASELGRFREAYHRPHADHRGALLRPFRACPGDLSKDRRCL